MGTERVTPKLLYSRESAAHALDVSVRLIDYAIGAGLLETRRINNRVLITAGSLSQFAGSDQRVPLVAASPAPQSECAAQ